jgi:hypothetical protein
MSKFFAICVAASIALLPAVRGQQASPKPSDRVVGSITAVDQASKKLTVKEDKTNVEYAVSIADTKTFLKVGTDLNLKNATRLQPEQMAVGDRVSIRGRKPDPSAPSIEAASVLVMSATDVEQKHESEIADWKQRGTAGVVSAIDTAASKLTMTVRTPEGPKPTVVDLQKVSEYTRYSPDNPKTPTESKLAEIQSGDQVRVLGNKNEDGSIITAEKVYAGSFRTVAATIKSVSADGKELTLNDLQTKQPVTVALNDESSVRKMPPMMANMLAMRLNPNFKPANGPGGNAATPKTNGENQPGGPGPGNSGSGGPGGAGPHGPGMRSGDMSQMIERLPKIAVADLKAGDAVLVSGATGADKSHLVATNIVAGVEPLFQSAPPRAGQSGPGEGAWNLDMGLPAQP